MRVKTILAALLMALLTVSCAAADLSVVDFGAVGDGKTDNTAAFQNALDKASKAGGGIVTVPAGHYRINGNLVIPSTCTLQGTYRTPAMVHNAEYMKYMGSVLLAYAGRGSSEGEPFIRLRGDAATVAGFIIYYPEWSTSDVPPIPYPPCIASEDSNNVSIQDCNIVNAYEAISLIRAHRHYVKGVQGYPIKRGLYVDQCYDIGRIENIHFWPFGTPYGPDRPYSKWINLNGVAFEFARTDWEYVTNTFCFGYGVGYKFSKSEHGPCNGSFLAIGADSCQRAVLVQETPPFGLLITNGEFVGRWQSENAVCLEILPTVTGKVSLSNCAFWGPIDKCVWMRAPAGEFSAIGCAFVHWDVNKISAPAVDIEAGRAILQGNTFGSGDSNIRVGKGVKSALIIGNQAGGGLAVDNFAGKATVLSGNQQPGVVLSASQKAHYRLSVGSDNDDRYIRRWQMAEPDHVWGLKGTMRWSAPASQLILPVIPGKQYRITMEVHVPQYAWEPTSGIYLGGKRIAQIYNRRLQVVTAVIPAQKSGSVVLDVKCKNWMPKNFHPGNNDTRLLGIALRSVTMQAVGTKQALLNVNTGELVGRVGSASKGTAP